MNYYKSTQFTYTEYLKENKTSRVSKFEKISHPGKGVPICLTNIERINEEEIFNSKLDHLDYKEERYQNSKYKDEENIAYFFKSKKENEYRLDLVILEEGNKNLKDERLHDKKFISVSFSIANATEKNYDEKTNFSEVYDIMSRIRYLIELNEYKIKENYIFMFGKPDPEKISKYEYFIKICFPDYRLVIDYTSGFPNTDVGYYLIK